MGTLTIRRLEESVKSRLRIRAAHHGRSMEEEARTILKSALEPEARAEKSLAESIHQRFACLGGVHLKLPKRGPMRPPPKFGK